MKRRAMRLRPGVIGERGIELTNGTCFAWSQFATLHNPLARIEDAEAERLVLSVDHLAIPVNFDQMVDGAQVREYFWSHWPVDIKTGGEDLSIANSSEGSS